MRQDPVVAVSGRIPGQVFWLLHFERGETMVKKWQNSRLQTQNVRIDLRVRVSNRSVRLAGF